MNSIKEQLKPVIQRIDAMTLRERAIIAATSLIALFFVWSAMFMDKQIADLQQLRKQINELSGGVQNLQLVQATLTGQISSDPNRTEQARLEQYLAEAERIDQELRQQTLEFISPQQMVEVLQELLQQERGLRLVGLESIQPEDPLGVTPAAAGKEEVTEPSGAYLHTMQLKFKGDYLSAMRYIQRLESLQWRFIWKSLSIQLQEYPVTHVELQLQTLGLTEGWIGV